MEIKSKDQSALNDSLKLANDHYENFPVASFLFPHQLRSDVALIYTFARTADDIADEGNGTAEEKLAQLNSFRESFKSALINNYDSIFWKLLSNTISSRKLNPKHFLDLLSAFEQDIHQSEYESFDQLIDYCNRSANPVGRIILELYDLRDQEIINLSDKICTALQLTNFWQDVSIDLRKGRVYIPLEEFKNFDSDKSVLTNEQISDELRQIIKMEVERTAKMFDEGSKILDLLPPRLKWQIKWTINGGSKILEKIRKNQYDVLNFKPTLTKFDYIIALVKPYKIYAK